MSLCTKCGVILHDADMRTHECNPENVPVKGVELSVARIEVVK
jgi:hypothetical protein